MCKGAKADLVFLIDGSWSIGDDSFNKVLQFVTSMTAAFDVISPKGMQVSRYFGGFLKKKKIMHIFPNICVHRRHHPLIFVLGGQVSFVQYSDDAKTEFKLNTYHDKGIVISALQGVRYRGGNTKTGEALEKKAANLKF